MPEIDGRADDMPARELWQLGQHRLPAAATRIKGRRSARTVSTASCLYLTAVAICEPTTEMGISVERRVFLPMLSRSQHCKGQLISNARTARSIPIGIPISTPCRRPEAAGGTGQAHLAAASSTAGNDTDRHEWIFCFGRAGNSIRHGKKKAALLRRTI